MLAEVNIGITNCPFRVQSTAEYKNNFMDCRGCRWFKCFEYMDYDKIGLCNPTDIGEVRDVELTCSKEKQVKDWQHKKFEQWQQKQLSNTK